MSLKDTVKIYTEKNNIKKQYSQNEKIRLIEKELEKFTDQFWEDELEKLDKFCGMEDIPEKVKYSSLYLKRLCLKRDTFEDILENPAFVDVKMAELKEKLNKISRDMKSLEGQIKKTGQILLT